MFDFAWSEIALIGVVALVLIGPKDMPVAIRAVSGVVKKARRMAAEFQTHVDDMLKDADMSEMRDGLRQLRSLDIRGTIVRAVDNDGSIRQAFSDPARTPPPVVTTPVAAMPEHTIVTPVAEPAPAFIPPSASLPEAPLVQAAAPAFIPPEAAHSLAAHGPASGVPSELGV